MNTPYKDYLPTIHLFSSKSGNSVIPANIIEGFFDSGGEYHIWKEEHQTRS